MTPEEREEMGQLCDQIAVEKNHGEFTQLMDDLIELLQRKEKRLEKRQGNPPAESR
jgi:hypothetical protein